MCKLTDWFKRVFARKDVEVKDFEVSQTIDGKTYGVPDSDMVGKIVINADGDPEIKYYKKEDVDK